jgi:hypothetical protein
MISILKSLEAKLHPQEAFNIENHTMISHIETIFNVFMLNEVYIRNHITYLTSSKNNDWRWSIRFPRVRATCEIPLGSSQQGLQLCFKPHHNRRFACEVMGPQSRGNPSCVNSRTPTWESDDFKLFFKENGIRKELTTIGTPHQNGIVKQKN